MASNHRHLQSYHHLSGLPLPAETVYIDRTQTLLTWADYFKATIGVLIVAGRDRASYIGANLSNTQGPM
eukprot:10555367-Heterocapsa_arctica.AAC.1